MNSATNPMIIQNTTITRTPVWRRDQAGNLVSEEPDTDNREWRELKTIPPAGNYRVRLVGMCEPYEVPNTFPGAKNPTKWITWVEFEIIHGKNLTGRWFSNSWTWSLAPASAMGKFIERITGQEVGRGEEYDARQLLGVEFEATVNADRSDKYAKLAIDSILVDEPDPTQMANRDQITAILNAAKAVYQNNEEVAKAKLRIYIKGAFGANSSADLTYEQADTAQNYLETTPHEVIVAKIEEFSTAEYAEVPF